MKIKILLFMLFIPYMVLGQVFEKQVYSTSNTGSVTLRESIITQNQAISTYCSAGYYYYDEGSGGYYRPVLYNRNIDGTVNFQMSYEMKGEVSGSFNAKSYAVAEDSVSGFITVGTINDYGSNTVTGGGDVLLLRYDENGMITGSKRLDFGYNEVAYDIVTKDENHNKFIICGTAQRTTGSEVFVAEIDRNLNVNWLTRLALKITNGSQPQANLFSLVLDENSTIWAVGDIHNGSDNDYLLVFLESVYGSVGLSRRLYNETDIEIMNDVSVASSGTIIMTGQSKKTNNSRNRMSILRFDKWQNMLQAMQFLRTSDANGQKSNIGYEIMETIDPSTSLRTYYVAGTSTGTGDGLSDGVVYYLNEFFSPQWQVLFESSNNISIYDADFINDSGNGYMNFSGLYSVNGSYKAGFDIKTDMSLYSGCTELLEKDTLETTLIIDTLIDSTYTTYSAYSVDTDYYVLYDSVSCSDEEAMEERNGVLNGEHQLFPNPIAEGEDLWFYFPQSNGEIIIYSLTGQIVFRQFYQGGELNHIDLKKVLSGIYVLEYSAPDGNVLFKEKLNIIR